MNKTSEQTCLWLVGSLLLQDRRGWTFDEDQISPHSAEAQPKEAGISRPVNSALLYFFYLLTHWHLSHTPTMNYISTVRTARVQFSLEMLGRADRTRSLPLQLRHDKMLRPPFKDRVKENKDGEKQKGGKMRSLSENYWNQTKIKDDWRISCGTNHYAEEQEAQQKNMKQKKTNTEGIWKKPHVALLSGLHCR